MFRHIHLSKTQITEFLKGKPKNEIKKIRITLNVGVGYKVLLTDNELKHKTK